MALASVHCLARAIPDDPTTQQKTPLVLRAASFSSARPRQPPAYNCTPPVCLWSNRTARDYSSTLCSIYRVRAQCGVFESFPTTKFRSRKPSTTPPKWSSKSPPSPSSSIIRCPSPSLLSAEFIGQDANSLPASRSKRYVPRIQRPLHQARQSSSEGWELILWPDPSVDGRSGEHPEHVRHCPR